MYKLKQGEEMTTRKLSQILQAFNTNERPKLVQNGKYYDGEHSILLKEFSDVSKPCNKIITNFCAEVVDNYNGYITGVPVTYTAEGFEEVKNILEYNDYTDADNELLKKALVYGVAYEIVYLDAEGKQRFGLFDSKEVIPIYDGSIEKNLKYVIRFYLEDELDSKGNYIVELYDERTITTYRADGGFSEFTMLDVKQHYYNDIPIIVFELNGEGKSVFEKVLTLQNAYNTLLSAEIDDFEAFCDAYMILKGVVADDTDLAKMKQNRILVLDADSGADYLTKEVNSQQIQQLLDTIEQNIRKISSCPNFNDETFGNASGIAMAYKLLGMENKASTIINNMTKALRRRIELLCGVLKLTNDEIIWRDVTISFTRNLPVNIVEIANLINQLRGIVSHETLVSQIPFISDAKEEVSKVLQEQKNTLGSYNFGVKEGVIDGEE